MKIIIAVVVGILAAIIGIYLGFYICFIGGIVQVVESIKSTPINSLGIAFGLLKCIFASAVGWGSFVVGIFIAGIIGNSK